MYYFEEIDSTNSWLLEQNDTGGKFCLAAQQSQGRGRRGRGWVSSPGSSVLLSMGWNPPLSGVAGISLVSGLAVVAALEVQGVKSLQLKWPNDIIFESKKLGGILVEVAGNNLVIGVGLNIDLTICGDVEPVVDAHIGNDVGIDQPWTDLNCLGYAINKEQLVADLLTIHDSMLGDCQNRGFGVFRERWNQLHGYRDKFVTSASSKNVIEGYARGVDESGALLVETDAGIERIISGEVSMRLSNGAAIEKERSGP